MDFIRSTRIPVLIFISVLGFRPMQAQAMSRDVKQVLIISAYGLAGGTLVGAAVVPLTQDARSIFIGSSVGLYLGIVVGIWYVLNRDDPNNPLNTPHSDPRMPPPQTLNYMIPGYGPAVLSSSSIWSQSPQYTPVKAGQAKWQLSVPVLRF